MYDLHAVKQAAAGHWPAIIERVCGISDDFLTTRHGPCPRCGGTDRWRVFSDFSESGGAICNQCGKFGDGLEVVKWSLNVPFPSAIEKVASFVGVQPKKRGSKSKADPAKDLEWLPWNEPLVNLWCSRKPPITARAVQAVGGRLARYRKKYTVVAIPAFGKDGDIVAWSLYDAMGGKLPYFSGKGPPEMVKVKTTFGSDAGVMECHGTKQAKVVWKTEGPTDLLALLSLDLPEGHRTCCNVFGAQETPKDWIVETFRDAMVFVVHDCDVPGQLGATYVKSGDKSRPGWAPRIATVANECRNVVLPFEIQENHGKDLRDWINDQLQRGLSREQVYLELLKLAEAAEVVLPGSDPIVLEIDKPEEDESDAYRLARGNLEAYQSEHGGTIKFWKDEFWRWKNGVYTRIGDSEFEAKVSLWIKKEFDRRYLEAVSRGEEVKCVRNVTIGLVKNVVAATKALTVIPTSIEMPCWLEDRSTHHWCAMRNGILDLEALFAGKESEDCLLPHNPNWFSSFRLNYDFDPEAKCERWLKYLDMVMDGDQQRIAILQEWCGYLLTSSNYLQKFCCFEGDGGNGKTVFFAAVRAMIGDENVSNISLEEFGDRFALWDTIGKAVNIAGDIGEIDEKVEANLKKFTGGDAISIDRKGLSRMNVVPSAKLMVAWNNRPRIRDTSSGPWRRMLLIPFNRTIQASERVLGMDKDEWWLEQNEVAGILNWAIYGLYRLKKQGEFTESKIVEESISEYRRESNPVAEFFEYIEESENDWIRSSLLFQIYAHWCNETGIREISNTKFFRELKRKFKKIKRDRQPTGRREWGYSGIKFNVDEIFSKSTREF